MAVDFPIIIVERPESVEQLCADLRRKHLVAVDVETEETIDDYHPKGRTKLFSVQYGLDDEKGTTYFVPTYGEHKANVEAQRSFIEDPNQNKALHNGKFDAIVCMTEGLKFRGLHCDTFVAEYTAYTDNVHPDGSQVFRGLKYLAAKYFGYTDLKTYKEEFSAPTAKRKGRRTTKTERRVVQRDGGWGYEDVETTKSTGFQVQHLIDVNREIGCERLGSTNRRIVEYACKDPYLTIKLYHHVKKRLNDQAWLSRTMRGKSMWDYYQSIERRFTEVLIKMEWNGAHLDTTLLPSLDRAYEEEQRRLRGVWNELLEKYGAPPGLSHTKNDDVALLLEKYCGLRLWKQTDSGKYSVDKKVLQDLLPHDVPKLVLQMRSVDKGRSTYIKELLECSRLFGGYVHSNYNQCGGDDGSGGTRTGRLSSDHPNGQNIPSTEKGDKDTEAGQLGRKVRQVYNAPPGKKIGCIDGSQIEVRMAALFSKDKMLTSMLRSGLDMHSITTIEVFPEVKSWVGNQAHSKKLLEEIATKFKDQRAYAKNVRFASQYKAGGKKVAQMCKVPDDKGYEMVKAFWEMHSGLRDYGYKVTEQVLRDGYVVTLLGRRGWIGGALNPDPKKASTAAYMQGTSTQFQGSVADLTKLWMILIDENCPEVEQQGQIHDELVMRATLEEFAHYGRDIESYVSEPLKHYAGVDLWLETPADLGVADDWAGAKAKGADGWKRLDSGLLVVN